MEEFVYNGMLFGIYKDLLKDTNKEYYSLYYEENLTLQEIADLKNVSKSYAGNVIKKTTEKLNELESNLKILENKQKLETLLEVNDINELKTKLKELL